VVRLLPRVAITPPPAPGILPRATNEGDSPSEGKKMKFASTVTRADVSPSLVNEVFDRDVKLATEAVEDCTIPAGFVGIIGDYRGHTLVSQRGRKARNAGETVVDLGSLSRIALSDLPALIERLQELVEEAPNALPQLAAMAEAAREAAAEAEAADAG